MLLFRIFKWNGKFCLSAELLVSSWTRKLARTDTCLHYKRNSFANKFTFLSDSPFALPHRSNRKFRLHFGFIFSFFFFGYAISLIPTYIGPIPFSLPVSWTRNVIFGNWNKQKVDRMAETAAATRSDAKNRNNFPQFFCAIAKREKIDRKWIRPSVGSPRWRWRYGTSMALSCARRAHSLHLNARAVHKYFGAEIESVSGASRRARGKYNSSVILWSRKFSANRKWMQTDKYGSER